MEIISSLVLLTRCALGKQRLPIHPVHVSDIEKVAMEGERGAQGLRSMPALDHAASRPLNPSSIQAGNTAWTKSVTDFEVAVMEEGGNPVPDGAVVKAPRLPAIGAHRGETIG